jgi:hypothetical protein
MIDIRTLLFINRKIKYIKLFILVQLLDLLTTLIGIYFFGFKEINPFFADLGIVGMVFFKLIIILVVSEILFYVNFPKWFYRFVYILSGVPVVWNILNILLG